ncbi:MAG: 30S ribosomal protein S4e, partial [Candidatus Nanohaloarchaea archaeon]
MGKHQKRLSAPASYPIERKDGTYALKGEGPHPEDSGVPIGIVLRDVLDYAADLAEAEQLLADGEVLVNGMERTNERSTVGFMDVIGFPAIDEQFRVLVSGTGFAFVPVDDGDRKLARIADKTTLSGGVTQLNLDD